MRMYVVTVNELEGFHHYPNAQPDVAFLKNSHRHIFYIECKIEVSHGDREVEIFTHQSEIEKYLIGKFGKPCEFSNMSCEMIACEIINKFSAVTECKVLEDGKGGSIVQR